jgi:hypothetical protein
MVCKFKVTCFQGIGTSIISTVEKTLLLLLIGVHIIGSVAGELHEMSDILARCHRSLLQILELLLLEFDYTLGYMMRSESHLDLILVDVVGFFLSFYICIPPISCGAHKLVRSQQNLLPMVALHNLKLLLHRLAVIGVHGFHGVRESWRLGPLEFSKLVPLLRLWCLLVLEHNLSIRVPVFQ